MAKTRHFVVLDDLRGLAAPHKTRHAQHNATLDGLRGVAAFAVLISHASLAIYGPPAPTNGNLAVNFFFILSGFVIARAYDERLASGLPVGRFISLRIIRLFPLIVLGTLLGAAMTGHWHSEMLAAGMLLIPYGSAFFPLDGPLWSLFYEFWANLLYAVVRPRIVAPVLASIGGALLTYIVVRGHHISGGFTVGTVPVGVGSILCGFFGGVVLSRWLTPERIERLPSVPFPILAVALGLLLINLGTGPWYDLLCALIIFPGIVALGAKDVAEPAARRVALFAGAMSYPIYVLHAPFVDKLHGRGLPAAVIMLAGILLLSYAALRWYDEPVREWLGRRVRRPRAVEALPSAATEI